MRCSIEQLEHKRDRKDSCLDVLFVCTSHTYLVLRIDTVHMMRDYGYNDKVTMN